VGVVLGTGAAGVLFADRLGVDHRTPFVQLVAFRPQMAAGLVVLALLLGVLGRRTRAALPAALALGLVGALGVAVVVPRSAAGAAPGGAEGRTPPSSTTTRAASAIGPRSPTPPTTPAP